ncbi:DUF1353 domain-containing protein [Roseovarius sp. SCSIO 43702]|uniref:DUF1353 domain-containing protein n=1 Tax=Roseovarius sp. SCSIO 43702 TaxID=2823043 RepID=UPI001C73AED9|nr:DUF1353 domain-containing protein [Roseovarius sp. SCSIO 43702]QYX55914.1 DUF1353 domain-containing protein [Roseovarius sp. SCSIO 43702]
MKALFPLLVAGASLSLMACDVLSVRPSEPDVPAVAATCERGDANCRFINSPVQVDRSRPTRIPSRTAAFYPTLNELQFLDGGRQRWIAHEGIITDGASIPQIFVGIVGEPTSQDFTNAAALHDAYCGIGNESGPNYHAAPWHDVHVMFYDALRVGGVPEIKAKVMFAAVWLGGPRWAGTRQPAQPALAFAAARNVAGTPGFRPGAHDPARMQAAMRRIRTFVEETNPDLQSLVAFITEEENGLAAGSSTAAGGAPGGGSEAAGGRGFGAGQVSNGD